MYALCFAVLACTMDENVNKLYASRLKLTPFFSYFFFLSSFFFYRIIDNMPVTWCYDVEDGQKYCNPGFPIGCLVAGDGRAKDACVINVSFWL